MFEVFRVENWNEVKADTNINPVIVHVAGEISVEMIVMVEDGNYTKAQKHLSYLAHVEAYRMPDGTSRLLMTCPDEDWPSVEPNWIDIYQEMVRLRWVDSSAQQDRSDAGITRGYQQDQVRRGGRPRKESHEWAYQQVVVCGRDQSEVFREWLEKYPENKVLADPLDSFKKGIKRRKGN